MKKFSSVLVAIFFLFSVSFSFAADAKKLTAAQEKELEQKAKKICDGMMPLYAMALDTYYKKKDDNAVRTRLSNKIDLDIKNKVYYTDYSQKDPLIKAVMNVSIPDAKKIMEKYPSNEDIYKQSIEISITVSLPPFCQDSVKEALRDLVIKSKKEGIGKNSYFSNFKSTTEGCAFFRVEYLGIF